MNVRAPLTRLLTPLSRIVDRGVLTALRGYQIVLSPLFAAMGSRCRFEPSCSQYMLDAVCQRGAVVGIGLGAWRLLRCNPMNAGGFDPVPTRARNRHNEMTTTGEQDVSRETI